MFKIIKSSFLRGIDGVLTDVEIDISKGIPSFNLVGLADTAIKESKERVKSAINNSNFKFPNKRIVINLSPASIKKEGVYFDLAIALGISLYKNEIDYDFSKSVFVGELSLNGEIKRVNGIISIISNAKKENMKRVFIPYENSLEASFIKGIDIYPIKNFKELIDFIKKDKKINKLKTKAIKLDENFDLDFKDIIGNEFAKRAFEIAACGGHNIFMIGPPGSGKTMLAKRINTIIPNLNEEEILQITKIYSANGYLKSNEGIIKKRPFRMPHYNSTITSLIGGGKEIKPGEIVLSHKGVLFLDEILEFNKRVLDSLRNPIEDKYINISRVKEKITYPCDFLLIACANPCKCGNYMTDTDCICTKTQIDKYLNKISGPMLDRFDMFIEINPISFEKIEKNIYVKSSEEIKKNVLKGRDYQKQRYKNNKLNALMNQKDINLYCKLDKESLNFLKLIYDKYNLSTRTYFKILKIARTIADIEEDEDIRLNHISEAFSYRKAYFKFWRNVVI